MLASLAAPRSASSAPAPRHPPGPAASSSARPAAEGTDTAGAEIKELEGTLAMLHAAGAETRALLGRAAAVPETALDGASLVRGVTHAAAGALALGEADDLCYLFASLQGRLAAAVEDRANAVRLLASLSDRQRRLAHRDQSRLVVRKKWGHPTSQPVKSFN